MRKKRGFGIRYCEALERRLLMAADLAISVDAFLPSPSQAEVSRTIRVVNNGDVAATDALVQVVLGDLENVSWTREASFAEWSFPTREPGEADLIVRGREGASLVPYPRQLGDVNADGFVDYGVTVRNSNGFRPFVLFGGEPLDVFVDGDVTVNDGSMPPVELKLANPDSLDTWEALGDTNGDGIDDFSFGYTTVLGRTDFAELSELAVSNRGVFSRRPVGDINGDGVDDFWSGQWGAEQQKVLELGTNDSNLRPLISLRPSPRWIHPLGDINADGFADFFTGEFVVLGHPDLGNTDPIRISQLPTGEAISVDGESMLGVGDSNTDGFDDMRLVSTDGEARIVFGRSDIAQAETISATTEPSVAFPNSASDLEIVGDLNGDGIDDVMTSLGSSQVLFRGPAFDPTDGAGQSFSVTVPESIGGFGPRSNLVADLNGDGLNDIMIGGYGPDCSCTASDRDNWTQPSGTLVVFNRDDFGENEIFEPDIVLHGGATKVDDLNGDGISDLVISNKVIFGSEDFSGLKKYARDGILNGQNGFRIGSDVSLSDINGDSRLDTLVTDREENRREIYLGNGIRPALPTETETGTGNIIDQLDIEPGQGVVYSVQGKVRIQDIEQVFASVSVADSSEDPRDNIFPRTQQAAQLELSVDSPPIIQVETDQLVTSEITIANVGPDIAVDVTVEESLQENLIDAVLTLTSKPNFESTHRDLLGPRILGRDLDEGPFIQHEQLGSEVGRAGDIDGDGKPDLYARTIEGIRLFWGRNSFAKNLSDSTLLKASGQAAFIPLGGDADGDGFDDLLVNIDGRPEHIAFGERALTEMLTADLSDLETIRLPMKFSPRLSPIGDINGDSSGDWATPFGLILGSEQGIFARDGVAIGEEVQSQEKLFAIGDINADGFDDFAAETADGRLVLGFGRTEFGESIDVMATGHHEVIHGGKLFACRQCDPDGVDVNGDGFHDLVFWTESFDESRIHVLYGRDNLPGSQTDFTAENVVGGLVSSLWSNFENTRFDDPVPNFGFSDFNGDGRDEFQFVDLAGQIASVSIPLGLEGKYHWMDPKQFALFGLQQQPIRIDPDVSNTPVFTPVFDVNGDEIDDLIIGTRRTLFSINSYGQTELVKGRSSQVITATKGLLPSLNIPPGGSVTLRISGMLPAGQLLEGSIAAVLTPHQVSLDSRNSQLEIPAMFDTDLNRDGVTSFDDYLILSANFGKRDAENAEGDIDQNGIVEFRDFLLLSSAIR